MEPVDWQMSNGSEQRDFVNQAVAGTVFSFVSLFYY